MMASPAAANEMEVNRLLVFCIGGNLYSIFGVFAKETVHPQSTLAAIQ